MAEKDIVYCTFCGESQHEVELLIAGPDVYICNECVDLCIEIIKDQGKEACLGSLSKVSKAEIDIEALGVKPRFNKLKFEIKHNHCFYLCPFCEPFNTIYQEHVVPCVESQGMSISRGDEIFGTQPIIEDVWEGINSSAIVIADVTGKNPNVMYEIGLAHTVGKPVVIVSQDMDDVPFDLKHYRCIIYSYTPKGIKELEKKLTGTLLFVSKGSTADK